MLNNVFKDLELKSLQLRNKNRKCNQDFSPFFLLVIVTCDLKFSAILSSFLLKTPHDVCNKHYTIPFKIVGV